MGGRVSTPKENQDEMASSGDLEMEGSGIRLPMDNFYIYARPVTMETFNKWTFPVHKGVDMATNTPVLAKGIYTCKAIPTRGQYAMDKSRLNFRSRRFDWMPLPRYKSWDYEELMDIFWLVFEFVEGSALTQKLIDDSSIEQREEWMKTLMFALCCCHLNNGFHGDVSDFATSGTIIVGPDKKLYLIDLGDGLTSDDSQVPKDALTRDIQGFLNFCKDHLFKNQQSQQPWVLKCLAECEEAAVENSLSNTECQRFFLNLLSGTIHYPFPDGMSAIL